MTETVAQAASVTFNGKPRARCVAGLEFAPGEFLCVILDRDLNGDLQVADFVCLQVDTTQDARLGMAVSKKNVRRAVDRNLVKRLVRESFRKRRAQLRGLDLVVLTRRGIPLDDNDILSNSLERHWRRIAKRSN